MTPRTFWDREGNLWETGSSGFTCWVLWHHEHGEEFVCLVSAEEQSLMVGCSWVEAVWEFGPLVATC